MRKLKQKSLEYYWVKDGRKYRGLILCITVILTGFMLTTLSAVLATLFPELVAAVLGIYVIYCGGNVTNKLVTKKSGGPLKVEVTSPSSRASNQQFNRK